MDMSLIATTCANDAELVFIKALYSQLNVAPAPVATARACQSPSILCDPSTLRFQASLSASRFFSRSFRTAAFRGARPLQQPWFRHEGAPHIPRSTPCVNRRIGIPLLPLECMALWSGKSTRRRNSLEIEAPLAMCDVGGVATSPDVSLKRSQHVRGDITQLLTITGDEHPSRTRHQL